MIARLVCLVFGHRDDGEIRLQVARTERRGGKRSFWPMRRCRRCCSLYFLRPR